MKLQKGDIVIVIPAPRLQRGVNCRSFATTNKITTKTLTTLTTIYTEGIIQSTGMKFEDYVTGSNHRRYEVKNQMRIFVL